MNLLKQTFSADQTCFLDVPATSIKELIPRIVDQLVGNGRLPADARDHIVQGLIDRENVVSTAIGHAVAVPHCYLESLTEQQIIFVRLKDGINLRAPDGTPTRFFFFLFGPTGEAAAHLDTLALIARLMSDDEFRYDLGEAVSVQDLGWALERALGREAAEPLPKPQVAEGLQRTGKFAGGIIADVQRRWPHYIADFKDGIHSKSIASIMFLFFACLAPAVTFGGVMAEETNGAIGAVEMILASAICGTVYALLSGQPLIVLAGTGPLLVFTVTLYTNCQRLEIPFLPTYAWVGFWMSLILITLAVTDASVLMRFFTRFTDQIYAALISVIFIYSAVEALAGIFHNLDERQHHDTALLSLLLALGTFYIANALLRFRNSRYLLPWMREFLADFGPTIAMTAMALIAVRLHQVYLDTLRAPETFGTTSGRDWTINPLAAPMWVRFAAIGPAFVGTVLVFLEQQITARLVNSPDHKLQKGEAYHHDLAVVGGLIGVCSMFGLPWQVGATVRSLNHVRSLAFMEESLPGDGQRHDRILHVQENRITGLIIHLLIGLSLCLLSVLKKIPMAVLYGLFLYMGVISMKGNQLFERLSLWAMDSQLYPAAHYVRRVPNNVIHKYTALQLGALAVLWIVKVSVIGLLFPLFIALLVPVRLIAGRWFEPAHLAALDADEIPEEEDNAWA